MNDPFIICKLVILTTFRVQFLFLIKFHLLTVLYNSSSLNENLHALFGVLLN